MRVASSSLVHRTGALGSMPVAESQRPRRHQLCLSAHVHPHLFVSLPKCSAARSLAHLRLSHSHSHSHVSLLLLAPRSSRRRQRSQRSHPFALHRRWHEPLTAFRAIPTLDPSSCPLRAFMTIRSTRLFLTKSTSIRINTRIIPSSISPKSTPGTHTTPTPTPTPTHLEPIPTHTLSHRRTCRPKATPTHRHHPRAVPSPVSPRGNRPTSRCIGNCSFRMILPTGPCRRSSLVPGQTSSRSTRGEQGD